MAQSLAKILVHIIFSTKERFKFLVDEQIRNEIHAYLHTVFEAFDSPTLLVGGVEDHVHILSSLSRNHAVSEVIREAKRNSSKWVKTKGGIFRKFHWQTGYGVFSVGQSQARDVMKYIANQKKHHLRRSFQDEFRVFLRRYEIEYDERYVWD